MSENKKNVDLNKVSYNFGTKGWTVIGFEIVMLFFMTGITVDGLNTIVPMMAAFHGWNQDVLLSISTPASIIALFACVLWAAFIEKAGLKKTTIITMVLAGISMIAYGNAVNIAMYAVALVCIVTFINAFACNCGFAICANWFPTKKGIVMGITTIGMNLASALINWILTGLSGRFQISGALSILGIAIIVLAVLIGLLVKGINQLGNQLITHLNRRLRGKRIGAKRLISHFPGQISYKATGSVIHGSSFLKMKLHG